MVNRFAPQRRLTIFLFPFAEYPDRAVLLSFLQSETLDREFGDMRYSLFDRIGMEEQLQITRIDCFLHYHSFHMRKKLMVELSSQQHDGKLFKLTSLYQR